MLKFNLPNLNKLRNINKQEDQGEALNTQQDEQDQFFTARIKPKYSAYRTVLINHDQMSSRINKDAGEHCQNNERDTVIENDNNG